MRPGVSLALTPEGRLDAPALLGDSRLRRLLAALNPEGEETRLVGGAVRNALLGLAAGDIDLATTLRPAAVEVLARDARFRTVPTGIAHGTVTVLVGGRPFEVTTLREDIDTDGRHAVVRFGRDFEADARRRDFTINALSVDRDGRVHDYVGGVPDLAARRVRFIGDATTRIREDYLRILRFFRFHAIYGEGAPDAEGLAASAVNRQGLDRLSRERVRAELLKTLAAPRAADALAAMDGVGLLEPILGCLARLDALRRLVSLGEEGRDPLLRLAALAGPEVAAARHLQARLRLSNAETRRLEAALAAAATVAETPSELEVRRLLFRNGRLATEDGLRLAYARGADPGRPAWQAAMSAAARIALPSLPVSGEDLLRRGLAGPAVGAALARIREEWSAAGFPDDPSSLESLIGSAVEAARPRQSTS